MKKFWYLPFMMVFIFSCSKYERLLKSDNYQLKYERALEYYAEDKVVKAGELLESILPIYRATDKIDTISYYHAMCEYKQGNYILAGHYFEKLAETYPNSPFAEHSDFMNGYCYYLSSPRPSLDQTNSRKAIEQFHIFISKYPESDRIAKANKYIIELRNKLVQKSFKSAKLYFDLEKYKASVVALNNSLIDFPDTKYREDILFLILKSSYLLADNSVPKKKEERFENTIDAYYSFIDEYPESNFKGEAESFYLKAKKYIDNN